MSYLLRLSSALANDNIFEVSRVTMIYGFDGWLLLATHPAISARIDRVRNA
jgi:hypothetical protein